MLADIPFLLAFTGGLVATVNPCGFAMLPAYLSFFIGIGEEAPQGGGMAVARALRVGATVAAGFVLVFGTAGILLVAGAQALTTAIPWAALVVGVAVTTLGLWLLSGRPLPVRLPVPGRAASGRDTKAVFLFGLGYAVASLSCTLPVFLAVVAGTAARQNLASQIGVFGVYAVGMALPLLALTVALALGRDALVRRVRALGQHTTRVSGVLLVLAGAYVVLFWATELTGLSAGPAQALVAGVERASARVTNLVGNRPLWWGAGFALLVLVALVVGVRARGRDRRRAPTPSPTVPQAEDTLR